MTFGGYTTMPSNVSPLEVMNSAAFAPAVLRAVQTPSLRGYLVPHSVPWDAVDVPMVDDLPQRPNDRAEINLIVGDGIARMVYRTATGRWYQIGAAPLVTELPTSPSEALDGLTVVYVADSTTSRIWKLRYYAAGSATYPWVAVGGSPLRGVNAGTSMSFTSTTYADASTPGPSVTVPLAGDYRVNAWAEAQHSVGTAVSWMAVKNGAAATADANGVFIQNAANNTDTATAMIEQEITVTAAATALAVQFKTASGTLTINGRGGVNPWITAMPIRVAAA